MLFSLAPKQKYKHKKNKHVRFLMLMLMLMRLCLWLCPSENSIRQISGFVLLLCLCRGCSRLLILMLCLCLCLCLCASENRPLDTYLNKAFHSWVPVTRVRDPVVWSRQSVRLCCQHKTGDNDESDCQLEHGVIWLTLNVLWQEIKNGQRNIRQGIQ